MSGGFLTPSSPPRSGGVPSASASAGPSAPPKVLVSLTPRQETRLRTHIDERFRQLERDERKHAFHSLPRLLPRLTSLLRLILQIPPPRPWGLLRIDSLLTLTGYLVGWITSLPLVRPDTVAAEGDSDVDERKASRNMRAVLALLDEVDKGWMAVLSGEGWVADPGGGMGTAVRIEYGVGVGATERIRLKSIIIASRAKLLAWARVYGSFPGTNLPGLAPTPQTDPEDLPVPIKQEDGQITLDDVHEGEVTLANGVAHGDAEELDWEKEVLGLWNGTLEVLADMDFQGS